MTQVTFPYQQGLYVWTSPYGYRLDPLGRSTGQSFHGGVDIASRPTGRTIDTHSPVDGIVTVPAFEANGAGNNIWITDADQTLWKFFHLSAIYVRTGQRVKAGELVARMGTTGASTGVHGHIERWQGGAYGNRTDPTQYLRDAETAGRFPGAAVPAPTPTPTPAPQPPEEDIMVTRAENQADMAAAIKPVADRLTALEQLVTSRGSYIARDERNGAMWLVAGDVKRPIPDPPTVDVLKTFLPERAVGAATLDALPSEAWAA